MKQSKLLHALSGSLGLQFLLGMLANFYSEIPKDKPYEVFHQFGYITLHAVNGTLLLVLSIVFLVKSIKAKTKLTTAWRGAASVVVAFVCGELFVFTQNDIYSLVMAAAFVSAFAAYVSQIAVDRYIETSRKPGTTK